jgi:hypothetical protein
MPVFSPATKNLSKSRQQSRRLESLQTKHLEAEMRSEIPPLPPICRFSTSLRYAPVSDSGSSLITYSSILSLFGVTVSTTSLGSLVRAVKLRKIHMWLPPIAQTAATGIAPSEASLRVRDFVIPGIGPEKTYRLTVAGKGDYACHKFRGIFSGWINNDGIASLSAEVLLAIRWGTVRPIIQLDFSVQLPCSDASTSGETLLFKTVDSTNANRFLFLYLDNASTATVEGTQLLAPMGVPSATVNQPDPQSVGTTHHSSSSSSSTCSGSCCAVGRSATHG